MNILNISSKLGSVSSGAVDDFGDDFTENGEKENTPTKAEIDYEVTFFNWQ